MCWGQCQGTVLKLDQNSPPFIPCPEAKASFWFRIFVTPTAGLFISLHTAISLASFSLHFELLNPTGMLFLISIPQHLFFQKSLKQRLGKSNIQARLGRPIGTLARGAIGGRGLPIIQRGLPRGGLRGGRATRTLLRGGMSLRGQCCVLDHCRAYPSLFSWAAYGHICFNILNPEFVLI